MVENGQVIENDQEGQNHQETQVIRRALDAVRAARLLVTHGDLGETHWAPNQSIA